MNLTGNLIAKTFHLERYLKSGAAGDVYLAKLACPWKKLPMGSEVAFKRYKDWLFEGGEEKQKKQVERIRREASLCDFEHENLVRIYGAGSDTAGDRRIHYLVMEYLRGETLTDFIRRRSP